jgi:hypothetical protein
MSFPLSNNRHADFNITITSSQDLSSDIGAAVSLTGASAYDVDLGADGTQVLGELLYYKGNIGTVRVQGLCTFSYTGAPLAVCDRIVSAGTGLVRTATAPEIQDGSARGIVIAVNTANNTVDVLL